MRAERFSGVAFVLACVGGLIAMLAWGQAIDDAAEAADAVDVHSRDYIAGHQRGRREMLDTVRAAYAQGRRDALDGAPACTGKER